MFAESLFNELPESYKEKENEVLPVYEQPLEKVELTDTREAEEAVKEFFEEILGINEDDGYDSVSDGADGYENSAQGEYSEGDRSAVQSGNEGIQQGRTQSGSDEIEEVTQSNVTSDSGEDSDVDSLYGSIDKFYL